MGFVESALKQERPESVEREVRLPRHQAYFQSPSDWRDEILYFLLVDRFSDGKESKASLLDRNNLSASRPKGKGGEDWRWDKWAESGGERWQGGTIQGVHSKLDYLEKLGVTTCWLSPVFKQRAHLDTYHGYGVQDFLEVDSRFGTRKDLVSLVKAAHKKGIRIILDVIFNHSGFNWVYPPGTPGGVYTPWYTDKNYNFGEWLGDQGQPIGHVVKNPEEGVWPKELQSPECYTRAGFGDLGGGDVNSPTAVHKRTDFITLRDFMLDPPVLDFLCKCYKYWIALTDCDGFRIDTLKHVYFNQARNFCGSIKEFASNLGKSNFFLIGEIAGGDYNQNRYLDVLDRNLNAALDIGEMRISLNQAAKGLSYPKAFFDGFHPTKAIMGSHRNIGHRHVSILEDHDHVFGEKIRFSSEASSDHQVVAGIALQFFSLGIPCIYYGMEQALAGPEASEREWLPGWKTSDRYLREAMFGPKHPRKHGSEGAKSGNQGLDEDLPGFGPFGTSGRHCFDEKSPSFKRVALLTAARKSYPVLRVGRQYLRPISFLGRPFDVHGPGEVIAWSRILDDEEALCILNPHGVESRGAAIMVDGALNPPGSDMFVVLNTASIDPALKEFADAYAPWAKVPVKCNPEGLAFVEVWEIPPSEVLVLSNHPGIEEGEVVHEA